MPIVFADGDQDYIEKLNDLAGAYEGAADIVATVDDHIAGTADKHGASAIVNTPAGGIAATDVQAAINELDTEKQPIDATLTALAGVATAADKLIYATGADAFATTDLTSAGRALLDDADASAQRTTLGLGTAATLASDTDTALAANSDTRLATQKAVKAYVDALIAASDAVVFKGVTDCSANPNYPAADAGHLYIVSVAGKIGGASGAVVEAGDMFICKVDSTASGNQATVGANWGVVQTNINGALTAADLGVTVAALAGAAFTGLSSVTVNSSSSALTLTNSGSGQALTASGGVSAKGLRTDNFEVDAQVINLGSSAAQTADTSYIWHRLFLYGTPLPNAAGHTAANSIVVSDQADADTGVSFMSGMHIAHRTGGGSASGNRVALTTDLGITGTVDVSSSTGDFVSHLTASYAVANLGGTGTFTTDPSTGYKGALFGGNDHPRLASGATDWYALIGREINAEIETGASAFARVGLFIVTGPNATSQAEEDDAAIALSNKATTNLPWKHGIKFGMSWGVWPFDADSTLIGAQKRLYPTGSPETTINANFGVDLSDVTFAGGAFKSNNFLVAQSGQIVSSLATGTAPFSVASTTNVANLNASSLNGATFAAPGTIGGGTPGAATFTTLTATGQVSLGGAAGAESLRAVVTANAVNYVEAQGGISGNPVALLAQGANTNVALGLYAKNAATVFAVTNNALSFVTANPVGAVNYLDQRGSTTGNAITLSAVGSDTHIDLSVVPKGANGRVKFGTHAAIGAETVTGYIEIKDAGGTVRKLAVVS